MTIAGHDSSSIHLISESSLSDLNHRIMYRVENGEAHYNAVAVERFRPNILVGGAATYTEDDWKNVQVGSTILRFRKKVPRCYMTLVNPVTGEVDAEPLSTLKRYRMNKENEAEFGIYLFPTLTGVIKVGDVLSF
jgi:uncharacterized protein